MNVMSSSAFTIADHDAMGPDGPVRTQQAMLGISQGSTNACGYFALRSAQLFLSSKSPPELDQLESVVDMSVRDFKLEHPDNTLIDFTEEIIKANGLAREDAFFAMSSWAGASSEAFPSDTLLPVADSIISVFESR